MQEILRRYPLVAALAAVGVLLFLIIVAEIFWGSPALPAIAPAGANAAFTEAKLLPSLASVSAEQAYPETGARPMFSPTRRPAPQAVASTTMAKGQYVLQGVTIVGDVRIALLRDSKANRMYRVEKGRDINGVIVSDIEPERVTLRQGDDSEVLNLTVQKPGGAAAAPSTTSASGPFAAPPSAAPAPAVPAAAPAQPQGSAMPAPQSPSGFGPPRRDVPPPAGAAAAQTGEGGTAQGANATPEELLARRRARRQGQQ